MRLPVAIVHIVVAVSPFVLAQEPGRISALVQPEATSLLGQSLYRQDLGDQKDKLEAEYASAKAAYDKDPKNAENIIWLGRRAAYLWRYREAIELFSSGIGIHPGDPRFYRHRGHRYISIRQFDKAIEDLHRAADLAGTMEDEVEPDGQPNAKNIPTSTLKSNIWYHLGLAYYLKGDFAGAEQAYRQCLNYARNDDMLCATADWLYMTLRRSGKRKEAGEVLDMIREDMDIIENFAYHRRLLMYKGLLAPEDLLKEDSLSDLDLATQGYGVANWYLYNGESRRAVSLFQKVTAGSYWPAFGYIAAEAELASRRGR